MPLLLKHHPLPFTLLVPAFPSLTLCLWNSSFLSLSLCSIFQPTLPGSLSLHPAVHPRFVICLGSICVVGPLEIPSGCCPSQYLLSRRSLIVIRSGCGAAQRWPMIAHPAILMLIACRLRATSNRRGSHNVRQYLSLSICAHDCSKDFLCNKD